MGISILILWNLQMLRVFGELEYYDSIGNVHPIHEIDRGSGKIHMRPYRLDRMMLHAFEISTWFEIRYKTDI